MEALKCSSGLHLVAMDNRVSDIYLRDCPQCGGEMKMEIRINKDEDGHIDEANPYAFVFAHAESGVFNGGGVNCVNDRYYAFLFRELTPEAALHICDVATLWNHGVNVLQEVPHQCGKAPAELLRFAFIMEQASRELKLRHNVKEN